MQSNEEHCQRSSVLLEKLLDSQLGTWWVLQMVEGPWAPDWVETKGHLTVEMRGLKWDLVKAMM